MARGPLLSAGRARDGADTGHRSGHRGAVSAVPHLSLLQRRKHARVPSRATAGAEGEPAAIVREHRAGIVVRPGDGPGLVDALRTLSGDAALRQEFGANGRHAAERLFDKCEIDNDFIEYLERLDRSAPAVGDVPRPVPSERT